MAATLIYKLSAECATSDSIASPGRIAIPSAVLSYAYLRSTDAIMQYGDPNAVVKLAYPSIDDADPSATQYLAYTFVVLTMMQGGSAARVRLDNVSGWGGGTTIPIYFTLSTTRPRAIAILPGDVSGVAATSPTSMTTRTFTLEAGDNVRLRAIVAAQPSP